METSYFLKLKSYEIAVPYAHVEIWTHSQRNELVITFSGLSFQHVTLETDISWWVKGWNRL